MVAIQNSLNMGDSTQREVLHIASGFRLIVTFPQHTQGSRILFSVLGKVFLWFPRREFLAEVRGPEKGTKVGFATKTLSHQEDFSQET